MNKLNEKILIHGFLDNSLTPEQIDQFNLEYRTNPEFALSVNSYLNIMSALKAADKMRERVAQKKGTIKTITFKPYYRHIAVAASLLFLITLSITIYTTLRLNKTLLENKIADNLPGISQIPNIINEQLPRKIINIRTLKTEENNKINITTVSSLVSIISKLNEKADQPVTRGNSKVIHIFPENSKLANVEGAKLAIKKSVVDNKYSFILNDLTSGDTLMNVIITAAFETILLEDLKLTRGNKYYWVVLRDRVEIEVGTFSYISKKDLDKLNKFEFNNSTDFVNAFVFYYENGFLFDAYAVLERAVKKYPSEEVFVYLASLMNKN